MLRRHSNLPLPYAPVKKSPDKLEVHLRGGLPFASGDEWRYPFLVLVARIPVSGVVQEALAIVNSRRVRVSRPLRYSRGMLLM